MGHISHLSAALSYGHQVHIVNYQNPVKYAPPKGGEIGIILRCINALYPDRKRMPRPPFRSVIQMNQKKAEAAHVW